MATVVELDIQRIRDYINDLYTQNTKMWHALERCAEETDYCYVCDNHPSHGHSAACLFAPKEEA